MADYKRLGSFLMERRLALGLSQEEVARQLGFSSAQYVSNWERGLCAPPLKSYKDLLRLYNIDSEEGFEELMASVRSIYWEKINQRQKKQRR